MDKKIVWYKEHEKVIVKVMSTPRMHKLDAIEKSGIPLDDISSILSVCIEEKSWTWEYTVTLYLKNKEEI